jgi:hypothetical protein
MIEPFLEFIDSTVIPTVNNSTITIQKNGSTVESFTLNQASNETINITVPTQASDIGALPSTTTINDLTSTAQQNAINSGITSSLVSQISTNQTNITTINNKIPAEATSTNKLADKAYVDNAIQTNSAHFRGNWANWAAVPSNAADYPADDDGNKTPTTNDYMVVQDASDYTGDTLTGAWQFVYTGLWSTAGKNGWQPKFQINEEPLTPTQIAALNSGANSTNIAQIGTNTTNITALQTAIATKADAFAVLSLSTNFICNTLRFFVYLLKLCQKLVLVILVSKDKKKSNSYKVFIKTLVITISVIALLLIGYFTAGIMAGEL